MSALRYPSLKSTNLEWLDRIPDHWDMVRLGFESETLVPMRDKPERLDGTIPWIRIEDFDGKFLSVSQSGQGVDAGIIESMGLKVFPVGTVLCSCSCSMGATAVVAAPLVTNQTFIGIVPKQRFRSGYLFYFFRAASEYLNSIGTGAIQTYLSRDDFRRLRLPCPPIDEQVKIDAFLDSETAKIDGLISQQRRLLDLLDEKRQAVISHAVTKGPNPDAPMKPSDVEWLGDVPVHWSVGAVRYYARFKTGGTPDRQTTRYWDGQIPWVKTGEINYLPINKTEETISEAGLASCSAAILKPGTLLMALYGQGTTRGRVAVLEIPAACNQACAAIESDDRLDREYLRWFFEFAYPFVRDVGNETTQMNLSIEFIRHIRVPIPPIDEQVTIVGFLRGRVPSIDALITETKSAIRLLQERRTALISAAVTGQIDVRGLAAVELA